MARSYKILTIIGVKLSRAGTFQEDLPKGELIGRPQAKIKKFSEKIDKLTSYQVTGKVNKTAKYKIPQGQ